MNSTRIVMGLDRSFAGRAWMVFAALLATSMTASAAPPRFKVQVLPPLTGGASCFANDINDAGQIVGGAPMPGTGYPNAVTWIDGKIINITGEGVSGAAGNAINADGVVVGFSDSLGLNAFAWRDGVLTPLPFDNACCSIAHGVNDAGVSVGQASLKAISTPNDGVMWTDRTIVPLGTLGGTLAHALDINNRGDVVGISDINDNGEYFPFVWRDGMMLALPSASSTFGAATGINDAGVIVGYYQPGAFGRRAAKWINGELVPLPTIGGRLSEAADINASGWIVGTGWTSSQASASAALWIDDQSFDLNRLSLIDADDHLYDARGINGLGQIVGEGVLDGHFRGYVLTPLSPGDVDGNGVANVDDLIAIILGWGACAAPVSVATCPADVNVSGAVDVDDLVQVILSWG